MTLTLTGSMLSGFHPGEGRGDAAQWCRRQQRKLWSFQFLTALLALTKLGAVRTLQPPAHLEC